MAAFRKALETAEQVSVSLFEVDAMDDEAKAYYENVFSFVPALSNARKLFLPMATVEQMVARIADPET